MKQELIVYAAAIIKTADSESVEFTEVKEDKTQL